MDVILFVLVPMTLSAIALEEGWQRFLGKANVEERNKSVFAVIKSLPGAYLLLSLEFCTSLALGSHCDVIPKMLCATVIDDGHVSYI